MTKDGQTPGCGVTLISLCFLASPKNLTGHTEDADFPTCICPLSKTARVNFRFVFRLIYHATSISRPLRFALLVTLAAGQAHQPRGRAGACGGRGGDSDCARALRTRVADIL